MTTAYGTSRYPPILKRKTEGIRLAVDGDILLWRFACANEKTFHWDEGVDSHHLDLVTAIEDMDDFIRWLERTTKADETLICLTNERNFRYRVLPTYKHNRADLEKPALYTPLKDHMLAEYQCLSWEPLEADDMMGILATEDPEGTIIATIDKDLKQIPGRHFNWKQGEAFTVSRWEADRYFYTQVLTGDSTDGYSGCPQIGPKKATKLLDEVMPEGEDYDEAEVWRYIYDTYDAKGMTLDYAIQQARVARILRSGEYDHKRREVKLWLPKGVSLEG